MQTAFGLYEGTITMMNQEIAGPNFFVVGAQKCGTTSIYEHMRKHPQVFLPEIKEPEFYSSKPGAGKILYAQNCGSLEAYRLQYRGSEAYLASGDFSTGYLWDPNAPKRIHDVCPEAKIIVMLRDPVVRAHSAYLMLLRDGLDSSPSFSEAMRRDKARDDTSWFTAWHYVEAGMYYAQVKRYIDLFGSDRVLVLMFDDFVKTPLAVLTGIARHIGIDPEPFNALDLSEVHNSFKLPRSIFFYRILRNEHIMKLRHSLLPSAFQRWLKSNSLLYNTQKPPLDLESRSYLQQVYAPDIARLENLLGRKLPELRKSWVAMEEPILSTQRS